MSSEVPKKFVFVAAIVATIFISSGCSRKSATHKKSLNLSKQKSQKFLFENAKQQDVPIPVGFALKEEHTLNDPTRIQKTLCYSGNLTVEQSVNFYKQSMEIEGWKITNFSEKSLEGLLFCDKADKKCAISIRPLKSKKNKINTKIRIAFQDTKKCVMHNPDDLVDKINDKKVNL